MKMKLPPGVTRPVPRPPSTPPPGSSRSATSTGTGGGGTTPAFRLPPTEVAGEALFHLATLASSGVVPDHVPFDPLWAVTAQYAAAQAGAIAAKVAVGDRLVHARGGLSPQDCEKGLLYLFSAAKELEAAAEGDREQAVPRESIRLRERERDGALRARLADENAEEQLAMENDLDTRGAFAPVPACPVACLSVCPLGPSTACPWGLASSGIIRRSTLCRSYLFRPRLLPALAPFPLRSRRRC